MLMFRAELFRFVKPCPLYAHKEIKMKWIIMVLLMITAIMFVICYALCVIAHDADERAEEMYRKWKEAERSKE